MPITPDLTPESYAAARAAIDAAEALLASLAPDVAKRGGAIPAAVTQSPIWRAAPNELRGAVEQYEILTAPPESLVAYIGVRTLAGGAVEPMATTWTGHALGPAYSSARWRVNSHMGSHLYQYRARIAGREYTGRGFGSGVYIRFRETSASKRARAGGAS